MPPLPLRSASVLADQRPEAESSSQRQGRRERSLAGRRHPANRPTGSRCEAGRAASRQPSDAPNLPAATRDWQPGHQRKCKDSFAGGCAVGFLEAWTQASAGEDEKAAPDVDRGPHALAARHRPDYPLSGCFPAEPNSVSSGTVTYHDAEQRFKTIRQRTLESMPLKIQSSPAAQRHQRLLPARNHAALGRSPADI
jgi:hypothetical protein